MPETTLSRPRIHFMDEVRGAALICVIFYHACFSLSELFNLPAAHAVLLFFRPLEPWCGGLFIFISGISSQLSRSNLRRGAQTLGVAMVITLVTELFVPYEHILFGVLHLLGSCMLLYGLAENFLKKIPLWAGLTVCTVLFLATYAFKNGRLFYVVPLPEVIMQRDFLFPFGICGPHFFSSDYYPLLPWMFVFFAGGFIGRFAAAGKFPKWMYTARVPAFSWIGRHALLLYIVHQPMIVGVAALVSMLISGQLGLRLF